MSSGNERLREQQPEQQPEQRRIAIYDLDRTITRRGTYTAFLIHMAIAIAPWRLLLLPAIPFVLAGYILRFIDRARIKELNQALMMGRRVSRSAIQSHVEAYADKVTRTNIRAGALAQIAADKGTGAWLVIASASYSLYVEPIAARLGFDHVVATDHMTQGTRYLRARIAGENCYDVAKLRKIKAWMTAQGMERADCHVRAYSDHVSDAPLRGEPASRHAAAGKAARMADRRVGLTAGVYRLPWVGSQ